MGTPTPFRARYGIQSRVEQYADAATITLNADTTDIAIVLSLSQTTEIANPTGAPFDGQLLQIRITSSASRALSFGAAYSTASSLSLPLATTGGGVEDYIGFRYSSNAASWVLIATTIGASVANVWRQFSQNIATKPRTSGRFAVTTTGLIAGRQILVNQATGTGFNADDIDDIEWDGIVANGIATSGTQFTCYWSAPAPVSGSKNFNYLQV